MSATGLVLAGDEIQQLFAPSVGKQPFFDSLSGVYFDGQKAYVYAPVASQFGGEQADVSTGLENSHYQIRLGNGTEGDLKEHAEAPASAYVMGN